LKVSEYNQAFSGNQPCKNEFGVHVWGCLCLHHERLMTRVTWLSNVCIYTTVLKVMLITKIGRLSRTQLVNILLFVRSFIHIAYLRSNYMFWPFFCLRHHQVDRVSYSRQLYNGILSFWYLTRSRFHR
jgi:hypothetical protein